MDFNEYEDMYNVMVNMRKMILKSKPHIKKYYKYRKLHSTVLDSMANYIYKGKYDYKKEFKSILEDLKVETRNPNFDIELSTKDEDDETIIVELSCYKNHPKLDNITDIYIRNNVFKNPDKVKMLEAMNNSYVGLFKVVDSDIEDGYLYLEDVFTKKKFRIIDVSMSINDIKSIKRKIYFYNRIITIDDISFLTGIHCIFTSENKRLMDYISKHRYKKVSDFARCIQLYKISKRESDFIVTYNTKY